MSVSFDWEFEEKEPRAPSRPNADAGPPDQRRRWLLGAVLFILLAVVGLVVRAWISSRLDAVEKVEAELRNIVELELKHIANGDAELFRARQDPADARWQARQVARYISNSISGSTGLAQVFAPAPGLVLADRPFEIHKVHVFGRVGRVELTHWFQDPTRLRGKPATDAQRQSPIVRLSAHVKIPNLQSPIPLPFHVTWFYRLDEDGIWYHTAPPDDYWGVHYSWHGTWLDIHSTSVEAEVLDPIAHDLALLVLDGCRLLDCPRGERYILSFESDLISQRHGNRWVLPALYLTGMPETEEARTVWQHALERWLVDSLAQAQVNGADVAGRVVYRQLVARLQAELDLLAGWEVELLSPDVELLAAALLDDKQHTLQSLWQAEYDPSNPEEMRLLEAEAAAMLQWIEIRVGSERLFELLPVLGGYRWIDAALQNVYRLPPLDFEAEWLVYLSTLTRAAAEPVITPTPQTGVQPLEPPSVLPLPSLPPGDQIALVCDNRIWVGNADGSNMVPLTAGGEAFDSLYWSPDGHRLVTTWLPGYEQYALYLLAADGSGGRLLTDDPALAVWPASWSPDGRQVIYWRRATDLGQSTEVWAVDVETGQARQLPGMPIWSPSGEHLVYAAGPFEDLSTLWLVETDPVGSTDTHWGNARQIADRASMRPGNWSSDGSKLALVLYNEVMDEHTIAIYDLTTERFMPLVTSSDLMAATLSSAGDLLTDGTDPTTMDGKSWQTPLIFGWSADDSYLVVLSQWRGSDSWNPPSVVLAVVALDGSLPRVLAYSERGFFGASWSPSNPNWLTFVWPTSRRGFPNGYLFDLKAGLIYTATQSWDAEWSPDGAWVAFAGQDRITIVGQDGQSHFFEHDGSCSYLAWNPATDLSALGRPVTFTLASLVGDWRFTNVRIYQDLQTRTLYAWGEVVNHTGDDQRIVTFNFFFWGEEITFPPGYQELIRATRLADGQSLPFGFTIHIPDDVQLTDSSIMVHVIAEPAEPSRDDLGIPSDDFDLSEWPDVFYVSGTWENPGPDLTEYVAIVVTVYGEDGQVLGWGWRSETDPAYLASGAHDFQVEVELSEIVAELDLGTGFYKVQLFGH